MVTRVNDFNDIGIIRVAPFLDWNQTWTVSAMESELNRFFGIEVRVQPCRLRLEHFYVVIGTRVGYFRIGIRVGFFLHRNQSWIISALESEVDNFWIGIRVG